ncbi:MAG: hypothetical protein H8D46_03005 [FCB group bacterium]|nr:hypothetical protein [FCB group bacterium]
MKLFLKLCIIGCLLGTTAFSQEMLNSDGKGNTYGFGLGIPYGVLGANMDYSIAQNLYLSAGIGSTVLDGVGYNIGAKYFFRPATETFRPRVSAFYGINSILELDYSAVGGENETKTYTGLSIGVGAQWMWGPNKSQGLDIDIIYFATQGWDLKELENQGFQFDEPADIGISIGYRRAF